MITTKRSRQPTAAVRADHHECEPPPNLAARAPRWGRTLGVKTPGVRVTPDFSIRRVLNTLPKKLGVHHKASVTSVLPDWNKHIGTSLGAQTIAVAF